MGTHVNKVDAKGRISIPAPFRASLRGDAGTETAISLVVRPSHNHFCIEAWPTPAFHALATPLDQLDVFSEERDDLAAALYNDAYTLEADKEGRIVLPDTLVAHAGLTDTAVFMGLGRTFQIWEPALADRRRLEARERARSRGLTLAGSKAPDA